MLEAVIFDFNGVIIDDEHLHCELFQELARPYGIELTIEAYNDHYLVYDDVSCFEHIFRDYGQPLSAPQIEELVAKKSRRYHERLAGEMVIFPGAVDLLRRCAAEFPVAIGSGARRDEVEAVLGRLEMRQSVACIVSADDVDNGKPHPETYTRCLEGLNAARGNESALLVAADCVVIEDTPGGVAAARAAGMRCLAVTHSLPAERLTEADRVVYSLEGLDLRTLRELVDG